MTAIRAILGFARTLYEYQESHLVGPYGDHRFVEDYTSVVRGEPIGSVVVVRFNEAGQAARIVVNHRPLRSVLAEALHEAGGVIPGSRGIRWRRADRS
jgi:hypothetical protein